MNKRPFSLRDIIEAPLIEIDELMNEYARSLEAKVLHNYRDYPSRTVYKKTGRWVKYIQVKFNEFASSIERNELCYSVFICSYKIKLPFLWFWNMYFDVNSKKCKEVGLLEAPINFDKFISRLDF